MQDEAPAATHPQDGHAADAAVAQGLTPWLSRPGRRVATSLGLARGEQASGPAASTDDAVVRALSSYEGPSGDVSATRPATLLWPLPRLTPVERPAAAVLFALLALSTACGAAWATGVLRPEVTPAVSIGLPAYAAAAGVALLSGYVAAGVLGGSFVAAVATCLFGFLVAAGVADVPGVEAGVLALSAGLILAWGRTARVWLGVVGGLAAGVAAGTAGGTAYALAVPLAAAAMCWPPRRPLAGLAAVAPVVVAAAAGLLLTAAIRGGDASGAQSALRETFLATRLLRPPTMTFGVTALAAAAAVGAAGVLARSPRTAVVLAAWAWAATHVMNPEPLLFASAAGAFGAWASGTPRFRGVTFPLAIGLLAAAFVFATRPAAMPDPAAYHDLKGVSDAVRVLLPASSTVMTDDPRVAARLADLGTTVVFPAYGREATHLLARVSTRRVAARQAGGASRGDVLLRYYPAAGLAEGLGAHWVLIALAATPAGSPSAGD